MNEKTMSPEAKFVNTAYGDSLKSAIRWGQAKMATSASLITIGTVGTITTANPIFLIPLIVGIDVVVQGAKKFIAELKTHNLFEKLKRK